MSAVAELLVIRGVHDTGIPMGLLGPMGIPWEWKHRLNSWEWEREWEWWTGSGREMGIVVWKKIPVSRVNHINR